MEAILKENQSLKEANAYLQQKLTLIEHELAELKRLVFGSKSERFIPSDATSGILPLPGLEMQPVQPIQAPVETITIERKKKNSSTDTGLPVRGPIPAHIPRRQVILLPEGIDLENAEKIGFEMKEMLELETPKLYVKQLIRPKFKLKDGTFAIAELPSQPIARSNVGAGLLAHILVSKFVDHLPLYRQRQQFMREGVDIAASTINDWVKKGSQLLEPLYEVVKKKTKKSTYLMADETPVPVLSADKPGSTHKGYHWAYFSPQEQLHYFEYHKSRGREGPDAFLKEFKGHLQTDGYGVYDHYEKQEGIKLMACMAHARRKFEHSLDQDKDRAEHMLLLMQQLYAIERQARDKKMDADTRFSLREEKSIPVLKQMEAWLKQQLTEVIPKSSIGVAIAYTLGLWPRLKKYASDGKLEIDNNLVENKIRPIALGRKNYLFAGSHDAAQRAAVMYTLFANCKLHDVNPQTWLADILSRINDHSIQKLDELLPQNWKAAKLNAEIAVIP